MPAWGGNVVGQSSNHVHPAELAAANGAFPILAMSLASLALRSSMARTGGRSHPCEFLEKQPHAKYGKLAPGVCMGVHWS
jgi:hypothetical protein